MQLELPDAVHSDGSIYNSHLQRAYIATVRKTNALSLNSSAGGREPSARAAAAAAAGSKVPHRIKVVRLSTRRWVPSTRMRRLRKRMKDAAVPRDPYACGTCDGVVGAARVCNLR